MDSAIKYPGGLNKVADWIVRRMPPHVHYVEPYFGSGAVLFAKPPGNVSEVVNDIDSQLACFWRVLQDPLSRDEFIDRCNLTPFSQAEFDRAGVPDSLPRAIDVAVAFFVRSRQSYMGSGKSFAALSKSRTRRDMNEQVSAWLSAVEHLPEVAERMRRVVVLNDDAVNVIEREDSEHTLFVLDPPWLQTTRTPGIYKHEYTEADHKRLLATVKRCVGKVMLLGYPSDLYAEALDGWQTHTRATTNDMQKGAAKSQNTLTMWCNFQ